MSRDYDSAYIRGSEKEEVPGRVELTSTDRQKDRQRRCGRGQKRLLLGELGPWRDRQETKTELQKGASHTGSRRCQSEGNRQ